MELRRYFAIIRRRWFLVALTLVAGVAGAYLTTPQASTYSAQTTLYVGARQFAGQHAAAHGCPGPNQLKIFLRAGMGPCQGRMCGLTVTEVLADARGVSPAEIGYYRIRPPIKPVTLGELAG